MGPGPALFGNVGALYLFFFFMASCERNKNNTNSDKMLLVLFMCGLVVL